MAPKATPAQKLAANRSVFDKVADILEAAGITVDRDYAYRTLAIGAQNVPAPVLLEILTLLIAEGAHVRDGQGAGITAAIGGGDQAIRVYLSGTAPVGASEYARVVAAAVLEFEHLVTSGQHAEATRRFGAVTVAHLLAGKPGPSYATVAARAYSQNQPLLLGMDAPHPDEALTLATLLTDEHAATGKTMAAILKSNPNLVRTARALDRPTDGTPTRAVAAPRRTPAEPPRR